MPSPEVLTGLSDASHQIERLARAAATEWRRKPAQASQNASKPELTLLLGRLADLLDDAFGISRPKRYANPNGRFFAALKFVCQRIAERIKAPAELDPPLAGRGQQKLDGMIALQAAAVLLHFSSKPATPAKFWTRHYDHLAKRVLERKATAPSIGTGGQTRI